jgi:hypothetical protein
MLHFFVSCYGGINECRSTYHNDFSVDMPIVVARCAAVMAYVLGSMALLAAVHFTFSKRLESVWFGRLSWAFVVSAVAQLLVLIVVSTHLCDGASSDCSFDIGGIASITAAGYWFISELGVACTSFIVSA